MLKMISTKLTKVFFQDRLSTTSRRSRTGKRGHKTIVWYTILLKLQNRMCILTIWPNICPLKSQDK